MILARTMVQAGVALALSALAAAPGNSQGLLKKTTLSAALAHEALTTAVETCAKQDQQVTGVVLDSSGVQQVFLRGDNAGIHTVEGADFKAYTALSFRTDGIDLVERSKNGRVPGAINSLPRLMLAQGGVVIKVGDEVVGAIGIAGARGNNIDTACARAGIDQIKDRLQ
jgi:uncharacterized protein GlcG (DUF336 family)